MSADGSVDDLDLNVRIQRGLQLADVDHLSGDGFPGRWWLADGMGEKRFVKSLKVFSKPFDMLGPILIDPDLFCFVVGEHQLFEKFLLEGHGGIKPLSGWPDFRLEHYHVEVQFPRVAYSIDQICEVCFSSSCKHYGEDIFRLDAQLHELDHGFIPTTFPTTGFLLLQPFPRCGKNAVVVPPSSVCECFIRLEHPYGSRAPYLRVRQGTGEKGVVKIVDMEGLDRGNIGQTFAVRGPATNADRRVLGLHVAGGGRTGFSRLLTENRGVQGLENQGPLKAPSILGDNQVSFKG